MEVMHEAIMNDGKDAAQLDTVEERRARRMKALKQAAGIWAKRQDIPADGLEYQRELRAEWP
ncbi:hypothetical protein [Massilia sp. BJB1822]|uniref:hypothetical protein n=1 Tax=Massilia sp. BJB1822 TaxID=2744470 RepID=UPI0015948BEF|nr:hypothetical protein [Massilia sp. BJB1822]NVD97792.1 hypothetical protein [Massilia sp. BJB1822]